MLEQNASDDQMGEQLSAGGDPAPAPLSDANTDLTLVCPLCSCHHYPGTIRCEVCAKMLDFTIGRTDQAILSIIEEDRKHAAVAFCVLQCSY